MSSDQRTIIFDRAVRAASGFLVTPGRQYPLRLEDQELRLYSISDDQGMRMNVSLHGRSLTNGGRWHLLEDEAEIAAWEAA